MVDIGHKVIGLETAARTGVPSTAVELGRLLCIRPSCPDDESTAQIWPGEPWLRMALAADPGDRIAAGLLAAILTQQIEFIQESGTVFVEDGDAAIDAAVSARLTEANRLYDAILAADPADQYAYCGLTMLRNLVEGKADDETMVDDLGSCYLVELDSVSGSAGYYEELVVTDLDELRWACEAWFQREEGRRGFVLTLVASGERGSVVNLDPVCAEGIGTVDWKAVSIPPLPGESLPVGSPVLCGGTIFHYGYSLHLAM